MARFRRCTFHEPNVIHWLSTWKVRRLNQLRKAISIWNGSGFLFNWPRREFGFSMAVDRLWFQTSNIPCAELHALTMFSLLHENRWQNQLVFLVMALELLWIGQLSSTSELTGVLFLILICVSRTRIEFGSWKVRSAMSESGLRHQILSAHSSVNAYLFAWVVVSISLLWISI